MFLDSSDFVGKFKIAKDCYNKAELDSYIEKYEKKYLQDLLGCALYDEFIDDLNNNDSPRPQSNRFRRIFNEFCIDGECGMLYRSEGILEMLKGFVYYHYVLDQKFKNVTTGTVVNETAFSRDVALSKSTIEDRYNLSVESYIAVQMFIMDNEVDYPEFNGVKKKMSFFGGSF